MNVFIGLDVSLASTAVCVLGEKGRIVQEAQVDSEPEALARFLRELDHAIVVVGLEAGPLSQWLHKGLSDAGFATVLMETATWAMPTPRCARGSVIAPKSKAGIKKLAAIINDEEAGGAGRSEEGGGNRREECIGAAALIEAGHLARRRRDGIDIACRCARFPGNAGHGSTFRDFLTISSGSMSQRTCVIQGSL